jgi:hypothetical protein
MNDGVPFLTEQNFTKNIGEVTGYPCEFFGKMLYLFFANGFDKAHVTMQRFFEYLKPYADDEARAKHSTTSFKIMDIDGDN